MSQLIEQLKVYHAQWQKKLQTKEALSLSSEIRKPLARLIHNPLRSANAPPIPHHMPTPQTAAAEKGFLNIDNLNLNTVNMQPAPTPNPRNPSRAELSSNEATTRITSSTPPIAAPAESMASTSASLLPLPLPQLPVTPTVSTNQSIPSSNDNRILVEMLSRKRVVDSILQRQPVKKAHKARTCRKCAIPKCPGRQAV